MIHLSRSNIELNAATSQHLPFNKNYFIFRFEKIQLLFLYFYIIFNVNALLICRNYYCVFTCFVKIKY